MLRTLYSRLALALMAVLLAIGLLYAVLNFFMSQHYQQQVQQNLNRDLAEKLIVDRQLLRDGMLDQEAIKATFNYYMMVNPSIEIYLLDETGKILSYSADPGKVKRNHVSLTAIKQYLDGDAFPLLGDDPRSLDRQKIFSVAKVMFSADKQGYLYVVLRGEEYDRAEQFLRNNYLFQVSSSALGISLIVGFVVGLLIFRWLTRRLQSLAELMNNFWTSNFSLHIPYHSAHQRRDEIDVVGQNYNLMAERIREQIDVLKQQDHKRRELVANVSHDLRTPLATLRGYLETLQLKGANLTDAERDNYLATALHHSERLSRLVEDLFELAKLDSEEIKPHAEPFALAELAQDVIQKFRLDAERQQVTLNLQAEEDLPFVNADIGLIERVLENLIGNALSHTQAGDRVSVVLSKLGDSVELKVEDTGCGIKAEELPHIFDRFYQADNKHRSGSGAGLGLAISRQILKLHQATIDVSSVVNEGTVFRFKLPVG